jgi:serine/threonine-protein kinase
MKPLSVPDFLDVVERSGLVDKDQLSNTLEALSADQTATSADSPSVCSKLEEVGLLTDWQGRQLLEGRFRGFFVGKYKLLDLLGTGGMGSVYLAEHVVMRRRVAIKVLPTGRVHDTSYLGRFHREARAAAALDHVNIVRAFDVDHDGDVHYLVMEYVAGRDLNSIVADEGPLDFVTAAHDIRQAAEGLAHAHRAGLVHRDIKPANFLVDAAGTVKLLDLGLARFDGDDEASLTRQFDERVLGTVDYLAPEQAFDSHLVDARADIYSLGCTLYFLLTGHAPFPRGSLAERVMSHQTRQARPLELERPGTPMPLAAICRRMMAKSPSERYQTADEVSSALAKWLESVRVATAAGVALDSVDEAPLTLAPLDDDPPSHEAPRAVPKGVSVKSRDVPARRQEAAPRVASKSVARVPRLDDWLADVLPSVGPSSTTNGPTPLATTNASRRNGSWKRSRWESPWFLMLVGSALGALVAALWLVARIWLG